LFKEQNTTNNNFVIHIAGVNSIIGRFRKEIIQAPQYLTPVLDNNASKV